MNQLIYIGAIVILCIMCGNNAETQVESDAQETKTVLQLKQVVKTTAQANQTQIQWNGKSYSYSAVDFEESEFMYDAGVWMKFVQSGNPTLIFNHPNIESYSAIRRTEYQLPEFNEMDGRDPIELLLIPENTTDTIAYEGDLTAGIKNGQLTATFNGNFSGSIIHYNFNQ